MYSKILFGHDGSVLAAAAIEQVAVLARSTGAEVLLVHAIEAQAPLTSSAPADWRPPSPPTELARDAVAQERAAALQHVRMTAAALRDLGVRTAEGTIVEGEVDRALADLAEREGCDLIVIAPGERSGFRRRVHGSTTERVILRAGCPVLLLSQP
jgi:nucleotide-binding universal stress UspA family protein